MQMTAILARKIAIDYTFANNLTVDVVFLKLNLILEVS